MRILCVCNLGQNRSKHIANHLTKKGHETDFAGASVLAFNKVTQQRIDWAQVIVVATKSAKATLEHFDTHGKRIIALDLAMDDNDIEQKVDQHI